MPASKQNTHPSPWFRTIPLPWTPKAQKSSKNSSTPWKTWTTSRTYTTTATWWKTKSKTTKYGNTDKRRTAQAVLLCFFHISVNIKCSLHIILAYFEIVIIKLKYINGNFPDLLYKHPD